MNLKATTDGATAYKNSDFSIISTPTNYDPEKNFFDTSSIESVIKLIKEVGSKATIVIKSTVPVGYTERIVKEFDLDNLLFSPEFLREGHALYDNLYPSRIVVSYPKTFPALKEKASQFASLLLQGAEKKDVPVLIPNCTEQKPLSFLQTPILHYGLHISMNLIPMQSQRVWIQNRLSKV